MDDRSSGKEIVGILAVAAIALVALGVIPWAKLVLLILNPGGVPLLFLIVLPFWYIESIRRGLQRRTRAPWSIVLRGNALEVASGAKRWRLHVADIAWARLASNGNWTESTLVVDALTLFDERNRQRVKIPTSASGFKDLMTMLRSRGVRIEKAEVSAPAYLD